MSTTSINLLALAIIAYSAYILVRVKKSPCFSQKQKLVQAMIIISVPFFGALFVHAFYISDQEIPVGPDRNHIPEEGGPG